MPPDGGDKASFFVKAGKLFSRLTRKLKKGEEYKVRTPTVTAAVRGTEFMVDTTEDQGNVSCSSGEVSVQKGMEEILLKAGKEVSILRGQRLMISKLRADRLREMLKTRKGIRKLQQEFLQNLINNRKMFRDLRQNRRNMFRRGVLDQRNRNRGNKPRIPGLPF